MNHVLSIASLCALRMFRLRAPLTTFALAFASAIVWMCFTFQPQNAHAQQQITVARQPVTIIPLGSRIHILSNRVDVNFNGRQDEGDSAAAWTVLDAGTLRPVGFVRLPWESVNMQRPAVDAQAGILYISRGGRISSFNMSTQQVLRDTVALLSGSALTFVPVLQSLLVSIRPNFTDPGRVVVLNLATGTTTATYQAGANVQQTLAYATRSGELGVAVLSEGNFGRPNSTVQLLTINPQTGATTASTTLLVGDTGNHLLLRGDTLIVTSNGSHELHLIDLNRRAIVRTISTGTSGFNGPREAVVDGDIVYVSTFSNDVRRFRLSTGAPVNPILQPQGRPEGLALVGSRLFVANAFLPSMFTSGSTVAVFDLTTVNVRSRSLSVTASERLHISIAPHPVSDVAHISITAENPSILAGARWSLHNALGQNVALPLPLSADVANAGGTAAQTAAQAVLMRLAVNELRLSAGVYTLQIETTEGIHRASFMVTR